MAELDGVEMPAQEVVERRAWRVNGWPMVGVAFVLVGGSVVLFWVGLGQDLGAVIVVAVLVFLAGLIVGAGLTPVAPGRARVLQILGRYAGTLRTDGLRWVNPISQRRE